MAERSNVSNMDWFNELFGDDEFFGFEDELVAGGSLDDSGIADTGVAENNDCNETGSDESEVEEDVAGDDPSHNVYDHTWLPEFDSTRSGVQMTINEDTSESEIFDFFFTNDIIDVIATETNRYAEQIIQSKGGRDNLSHGSRMRAWVPVSRPDIRVFLGLLMLFGLDRRQDYPSYWSTDPIIEIVGVRRIMSRDRFLIILQFLHLADNSFAVPSDDARHDRLLKIRRFSEMLVSRWQLAYYPRREIAIDETLIPFKGRTIMKQYKPNKPHKWGLNAWTLADSRSGYAFNWSLYTGRKDEREVGLAHGVVMSMVQPIVNRSHHLYVDNFFTSPALFSELSSNGIGACGTLRLNRSGVPVNVKDCKDNLKKGCNYSERDGKLMYISWHDKRLVNIVTTIHNASTFERVMRAKNADHRRSVEKPKAIEMYTRFMGGVDRADQGMWHAMNIHKSLKWWKKVFLSLLEVSYVNATVVWKQLHQDVRHNPTKFRLAIIRKLTAIDSAAQLPNHVRQPTAVTRLTGRHFAESMTTATTTKAQARQDCVVCSDRRAKRCRTTWRCEQCKVPLCVAPCFKRYHTLENYKISCSDGLHL